MLHRPKGYALDWCDDCQEPRPFRITQIVPCLRWLGVCWSENESTSQHQGHCDYCGNAKTYQTSDHLEYHHTRDWSALLALTRPAHRDALLQRRLRLFAPHYQPPFTLTDTIARDVHRQLERHAWEESEQTIQEIRYTKFLFAFAWLLFVGFQLIPILWGFAGLALGLWIIELTTGFVQRRQERERALRAWRYHLEPALQRGDISERHLPWFEEASSLPRLKLASLLRAPSTPGQTSTFDV